MPDRRLGLGPLTTWFVGASGGLMFLKLIFARDLVRRLELYLALRPGLRAAWACWPFEHLVAVASGPAVDRPFGPLKALLAQWSFLPRAGASRPYCRRAG